ncbi:hypothetical protein DB30_05524 [Enhygromyxa salina]|uniref:Uncharacterized protein n=1 Tax=Enhygromyxa salina TaxID=215803 RepID=A0A0C2CWU4_9BACT|nr:hypothetical protein [Enhygromyxa salina]KIG15501.1 hypothetical protein DB30_05524 [Enhygromyxa salina]
MRARQAAVAGLCALVMRASLAAAAPPPATPPAADDAAPAAAELVLIRVVPDDKHVTARLRAELGVMALDSALLDVPADAPALETELLDRLDQAGASAAIEITIDEQRIEVWVADGATGKTLTRRFDLALDPEQAEPRTLAIAAVELLRASRLEFARETVHSGEAPAPDSSDPQATESERPPDADRPEQAPPLTRGALSLAPMIGGGPGGLGVTTHIELAGRWTPGDRFALRVALWLPSLGNSVANEQGRARVFVGMAFIEPQLRLPGGAPWFHPELGLGLGAAITGIDGAANPPFRSNTSVLAGFASHVHLGLGFALTPRLWARLDGYVGAVLPQPTVVFVDEVVAGYGLPFATGSLGLEIWI